jgi:hypothetical protein
VHESLLLLGAMVSQQVQVREVLGIEQLVLYGQAVMAEVLLMQSSCEAQSSV